MMEEVSAYFDRRAESYSRLAKWTRNRRLIGATLAMLKPLDPDRVVDFGAGSAHLLRYFRTQRLRIAVDISGEMLRKADSKGMARLVADVHSVPIASNSVDLVLCRQVLHYCRQRWLVLAEALRILEVGGHLHVVQIVDYDDIPGKWYKDWCKLRNVKGRTHLSAREILQSATRAGFALRKQSTCLVPTSHTWPEFFEKNRVLSGHRKEVETFFGHADPKIVRLLRLRVSKGGISYVRRFGLFLFRKNSGF
jgi:ubiquinone/menaquinone biosynthesis C-methylase UbiE